MIDYFKFLSEGIFAIHSQKGPKLEPHKEEILDYTQQMNEWMNSVFSY